MDMGKKNTIIIGGGIHGCSIALFLSKAGYDVTIIDKNIPGRHASGVNAGGLRLLLRDIREYPLAIRAMEMWGNLAEYVGEQAAFKSEVQLGTSQIALAMDEEELKWANNRLNEMNSIGIYSEEFIDVDELHNLLPGLSDTALGGLISRGDGHANPANSSLAFRNAAEGQGVKIVEKCRVLGLKELRGNGWQVETSLGDFYSDFVINCAGAWGKEIAALAGELLPVQVQAPTMMVTARVAPWIKPVVIGIDRPLSFKQSAVGTLIIGGGISGKPCPDKDASFTVIDRLSIGAQATIEAFPQLAEIPIMRTWTGLEALTPDGIPYIGPSYDYSNLWHVFGFCGHGFLLAPAVGESVANSLITGVVDPRLKAFSTSRFSSISTSEKVMEEL